MAIGLIHDGPGVTRAQYERVHNDVAPGNAPPPGLLYHAAGLTETCRCVMEVWNPRRPSAASSRKSWGSSRLFVLAPTRATVPSSASYQASARIAATGQTRAGRGAGVPEPEARLWPLSQHRMERLLGG